MAVRMTVLHGAVGGHDPRVLEGSTPEQGIVWKVGQEIVVTDDLADKFEASGMAERVAVPVVKAAPRKAESAMVKPAETAARKQPEPSTKA